jgi:uncharacterized membrane protein
MLSQEFVTVDHPHDVVVSALVDAPQRWTVALDSGGSDLLADVGVRVIGVSLYKRVQLTIGANAVTIRPGRTVLPVAWRATGGAPLFPRMEGGLEVEAETPERTRVTLSASYDPPLGALGQLLDRALLNKLADSTMKDFLERVARELEAELAASHAISHPSG